MRNSQPERMSIETLEFVTTKLQAVLNQWLSMLDELEADGLPVPWFAALREVTDSHERISQLLKEEARLHGIDLDEPEGDL